MLTASSEVGHEGVLARKLGRLKSAAIEAGMQLKDNSERSEYWDGYLEALWFAIEVVEDRKSKGVV